MVSACFGPFFPLFLIPHWLKYRTLRYTFDDQGVSLSWGAVHRRETRLNYSRLQDIHLSSNLFERWIGLAKVQLQTASGSAKPEMTLEGIREFQLVKDFLYQQMRGTGQTEAKEPSEGESPGEAVEGLREIARELGALRALIEQQAERDRRL